MTSQDLQKYDLPDCPGVYYFLGPKKEILYVGKATSLKERTKSYFTKDLMSARGPLLVKMMQEAVDLKWTTTDSVLEALIYEANQIKKHNPPYNTAEKDNKSFNMVVITDEDFPQLLVMRSRSVAHWNAISKGMKAKAVYGPFPHGGELREALKIIRRIFPYRDNKCTPAPEQRDPIHPRPCFNAQIGLCPGVCAGWVGKTEYRKQVKRIRMFFEANKAELVKDIEGEMKACAKEQKFEEANAFKGMLYALEHIQDIALIKRDIERVESADTVRIEAYDIAHMSGKSTVGVMTVIEDGELEKSQYRKFRIRGKAGKVGVDDTSNLKEVLRRRFTHAEWQFPNIIAVDGGVAQINAAKEILKELDLDIALVSVLKDTRHKAKEILGDEQAKKDWEKSILLANAEAHRFAITYHRKLRGKGFRI
ncbi:MAG: UvrABC system protein excinuclease subunit [Parcubacteria group bacterium]|nr:UvrABC system protein excinuclease subunit [Parcubacteria group bacterium]